MMHTLTPQPEQLLARLDAIAQSLAQSGQGLALLGLGSVGIETDRLDTYSDLDFFAIVEQGSKARFINNLDWLSSISEVGYAFQNTVDGYKLLYRDGVFCEFAVFEPSELPSIPFTPGRIVWQREDFDPAVCTPSAHLSSAPKANPDLNWQVGEALTNLYVGMCRDKRGESLSAMRFIQHFALDRLIEINAMQSQPKPGHQDPFMVERRLETRYPEFAAQLPQFAQGYQNNAASALAQLAFLEAHFAVNTTLSTVIKGLCKTSK